MNIEIDNEHKLVGSSGSKGEESAKFVKKNRKFLGVVRRSRRTVDV